MLRPANIRPEECGRIERQALSRIVSFRRPGKAIHEQACYWEEWRTEHRAVLERTGLPESVLQDEEHWWDFLMHGRLDHHPDPLGFSVRQLSREQQRELR